MLKILEDPADSKREVSKSQNGPILALNPVFPTNSAENLQQTEVLLVKKFLDILSAHIKTQTINGFQDSLLLLQFLTDMGLDASSVGYLAEDLHLSKSQ